MKAVSGTRIVKAAVVTLLIWAAFFIVTGASSPAELDCMVLGVGCGK